MERVEKRNGRVSSDGRLGRRLQGKMKWPNIQGKKSDGIWDGKRLRPWRCGGVGLPSQLQRVKRCSGGDRAETVAEKFLSGLRGIQPEGKLVGVIYVCILAKGGLKMSVVLSGDTY